MNYRFCRTFISSLEILVARYWVLLASAINTLNYMTMYATDPSIWCGTMPNDDFNLSHVIIPRQFFSRPFKMWIEQFQRVNVISRWHLTTFIRLMVSWNVSIYIMHTRKPKIANIISHTIAIRSYWSIFWWQLLIWYGFKCMSAAQLSDCLKLVISEMRTISHREGSVGKKGISPINARIVLIEWYIVQSTESSL